MYIKEAAERVGLAAHTLRFYEHEGLLPFIKRDSNGNRMFYEKDLSWIDLIVCLRKTDISLSELREFVELTNEEECTELKSKLILGKYKQKMIEKQRDLDKAVVKIKERMQSFDELETK
ncbi:MerR family transcriptional regulator [Cytobacillus oceanisediminis]|uniref:MerR family transcriptional regulator n=1 Tax=Niallia alba TaxID=2729105 RepID=A0A7Y0K9A5_9BACI|nr:MerR family transcriptional regulator [Cytobacillus oceanisediminis]NMO77469.1 MerR family transcriptional regulator [Niallia alba]